jgi:hypothetical protein
MELPGSLEWTEHRGETEPILGWYSPGLGRREPATTLVGTGHPRPDLPLVTRLVFLDLGDGTGADLDGPENTANLQNSQHTTLWLASDPDPAGDSDSQAEAR